MSVEQLCQHTEEVVTEQELRDVLTKSAPRSYWGVAPTGEPHLGYYRIVEQQQTLIDAGFEHTILIADLHAYLDDEKCPWNEMDRRATVYEKVFALLGLEEATFVRGSRFQRSEAYVDDLYHAIGQVTADRAERAASEVVRGESPTLGSLTYPVMQNLDCKYLNADLALGGIDQRHVYMLGRELLPTVGYKKLCCLFTPLGKSPSGTKMSASEKETCIELWAPEDQIEQRISAAYCPPQQIEDNPVADYVCHFVFPQLGEFIIEREHQYGGDVQFTEPEQFVDAYKAGDVHPPDLKPATATAIAEALRPVREYFRNHRDLLDTFDPE